uniref:Uncharacterized protein n=1 Tax=Oryza punctata TaxID=4537 RepID=A0A0E0K526_ORYPU
MRLGFRKLLPRATWARPGQRATPRQVNCKITSHKSNDKTNPKKQLLSWPVLQREVCICDNSINLGDTQGYGVMFLGACGL